MLPSSFIQSCEFSKVNKYKNPPDGRDVPLFFCLGVRLVEGDITGCILVLLCTLPSSPSTSTTSSFLPYNKKN